MSLFTLRSTAPSIASSNWEDVSVGFSGMPAELGGTDGRKVRMDITGSDWGAYVDTTNGASVTRVVGGAYDGTDCLRIVPPSGSTPNPQQTYAAIMAGLDLSNGGAKSAYQGNLGFCLRFGSTYYTQAATSKIMGFLASQTVGGATNASESRLGWFEALYNSQRVFSVTATTVASYHYPTSGVFPDTGDDTDKPCMIGGTSNHANDPPLVSTEWLWCEQEVDYSRTHGNADGRNRLNIYAQDGLLGILEIPCTWRAPDSWDFSWQYARQIEYIGGLWNNPSTADANNYLDVSHPIVALNRGKDNFIGPPTGFLT